MFSTIGKKTRVIFWNLCSMEKFLVAVAVALLFWGPDHSQVPNQDKILPCREAAITVSWGGGRRRQGPVVGVLKPTCFGQIGLKPQKRGLSRSRNLWSQTRMDDILVSPGRQPSPGIKKHEKWANLSFEFRLGWWTITNWHFENRNLMDTDMENRLDDLTNNCSDVTRATHETEMVLT